MKAAIAILFSLLLALNAPVATVTMGKACKPSAASCACSACDTAKCCVAKKTPASTPVPAAPARTLSHESLQLLAAFSAAWLTLPAPAATSLPIDFTSPVKSAAVPLYEWNCSYLI